ncbi:NAD-P-binding protein [Auriscalpium vulgare]|uniref:NAD-P-binding protein n=1 Tax=Auriscalpium vulgare TaxID=40419 RepID=A0ACB8REZ4_9AGAM|nr:NAD-P-binding protein [Auriscalpium vulgare]
MTPRPIFVVAGVGNGSGTGGASARVFLNAGYRVALIARKSDELTKFAGELKAKGEAEAFPIAAYTYKDVETAFSAIKKHWPDSEIRVALYNAGIGVWKPFLQITEEDIDKVTDSNVKGAFAFAKEAVSTFKDQALDGNGKRGTLLFTGATASIRGNVTTSAFAAGKFSLRSLSQSLAKEFGKQNIHVAHAVIDGAIATDKQRNNRDPSWADNADVRLDPESIAKSYLYLANQDRSAWTWELDLRPAHEKW